MSSHTGPRYDAAPLPSPTSTAPQHFHFPPPRQPPQKTTQMQSGASRQQQSATSEQVRQQGSDAVEQAGSQSHDPSSAFRRDFNLLAEAARRAQLAVITRDLDEVGL